MSRATTRGNRTVVPNLKSGFFVAGGHLTHDREPRREHEAESLQHQENYLSSQPRWQLK